MNKAKSEAIEGMMPEDIRNALIDRANIDMTPVTFLSGAKWMWVEIFKKYLSEQMVKDDGKNVTMRKIFFDQMKARSAEMGVRLDAYIRLNQHQRQLTAEGLKSMGHREDVIESALAEFDKMLNQFLIGDTSPKQEGNENGK